MSNQENIQVVVDADLANRTIDALERNILAMGKSVARSEANFKSLSSQMSAVSGKIAGISSGFGKLGGLVAGIFGAQMVGNVIKTADSYSRMEGQLKLVTKSQEEFNKIQGELFNVANRTNSSLSGTTDLFSNLSRTLLGMGKSNEDAVKLTETISKLAKIGGGSQQGIDAALVQLGQALGSGQLQAEELNSILDQTPALARAIAEGLDVPVGKLKGMAAEGEITSAKLVGALQKAKGTADKMFDTLPGTVEDALTQAQNRFTNFVGMINRNTNITSYISTLIKVVSEKLFGVTEMTEKTAADIGTKMIEMFEKFVLGAAEIMDAVRPTFNILVSAMNNMLTTFNALPDWLQTAGIVGAFLFGRKGIAILSTIGVASAALDELAKKMGDMRLNIGNGRDTIEFISPEDVNYSASTGGPKSDKPAVDLITLPDQGSATETVKSVFAEIHKRWEEERKKYQSEGGFLGGLIKVDTPDAIGDAAAKKLTTTLDQITGRLDPAIAKEKEYAEAKKFLTDLLTKEDAALKKIGTSREEINKLLERNEEWHTRETDIIGENIKSLDRQIGLFGLAKEARQAEAQATELANQIKLAGLTVDEKQLDLYRQKVAQLEKLEKLDSFNENFNDSLKGMQDEAAVLGMTNKEREKATKLISLQRDAEKAGIADVSGYVERYSAALDQLEQQQRDSQTFGLGLRQGIENYMDTATNMAEITSNAISDVFYSLEDSLAEAFETGKFNAEDFLGDLGKMFARFAAQQAVANVFGMFSAGGSSLVSSLFGGFRAEGGPVEANKPYVVGEKQAELFVPRQSGYILPSVPKGGSGVTINMPQIALSVTGDGTNIDYDRIQRDIQAMHDRAVNTTMVAVMDELRHGGGIS